MQSCPLADTEFWIHRYVSQSRPANSIIPRELEIVDDQNRLEFKLLSSTASSLKGERHEIESFEDVEISLSRSLR